MNVSPTACGSQENGRQTHDAIGKLTKFVLAFDGCESGDQVNGQARHIYGFTDYLRGAR